MLDPRAIARLRAKGRRARTGISRLLHEELTAAEAHYRRAVSAVLIQAAKRGIPVAVTAIAERARALDVPEPLSLPKDPIKRRLVEAAHLRQRQAKAEADGSHVAAANYAKQARDLEEQAEALASKSASARASLETATMEERLHYDEEDSAACSLDDLEVYVEEWCRRQRLTLSIVDGSPTLTRG